MFEEKLNDIYYKIADTLDEIIPESWDKIYMYGEVLKGAKEAYFYYYPSEGNNQIVYSQDIPKKFNISKTEYYKLLLQLVDNITELWTEFKNNELEPWTNLTFILESNGEFNIDYDYTDLSEANPIERHIIWKYKYLNIIPEDERYKKFVDEYIKSTQK